MSPKARNIIGWVLSGLIAASFITGGVMSFFSSPGSKQKMLEMKVDFTNPTTKVLGVVQILSAILFLIPRTGVLGTMLLTAYLGGAICVHLQAPEPAYTAIIFEAIVWITALIRFPEIGWRLFGVLPD